MANFLIVSKPVKICFECPFCEQKVEIPFKDVAAPESWQDEWPDVQCPECKNIVSLGDWEYD